ncbi:Hemoglobin and hemoglobin-haptoglobin-binding protein A precursor, partial [Haemophilus influenzae]
CKNI